MEHHRQSLAESLVKRRHLLSQIVQGTTAPYVLGPNRTAEQYRSKCRWVIAPQQRTQPLGADVWRDDLFDDGVSQSFLAVEVVVERSLGDPGGRQNCIDAGALEA